MNRIALLMLTLLLTLTCFAQGTQQAPAPKATDFSGMYSFLRDGEFVQITLEDKGNVTGFISRYGDLDSDRGVFLDQFFKKGSTDGTKLEFTTEPKHGVWFEFSGTVARGEGKTPQDEAFWVVKGKLTRCATDAHDKVSAQSREIVMKSFPQDAGIGSPEPKD